MASLVNVPNVPGVPVVAFNPDFTSAAALLSSDTLSISSPIGPQWGIFLNGAAVVTADTVIGFDYRQEWVISDYPLEQGSFESYDKVATPFEARVQFVAGISLSSRQALIDSIAAIAGDLNLYDVVTPEVTYSNVNVKHYDYRRTTQNGSGLIVVDVWLEEIRIGTQTFASTASPTSAASVDGGQVQPTSPTSSQTSGVTNGIGGD